jgi:hypothetical protein
MWYKTIDPFGPENTTDDLMRYLAISVRRASKLCSSLKSFHFEIGENNGEFAAG